MKLLSKLKMTIVDATHASVGIVAFFAAVISYTHIRDLAMRNGYDHFTSYLLPLSVDGLIVGASLMLVLASRERLSVPLARCALWLGIGATISANIAYGAPESLAGPYMRATVCAWPALAFIVIVEAWMQLKKSNKNTTKTASVVKPIRRRLTGAKAQKASSINKETQASVDLGEGGSVEHVAKPRVKDGRGRTSKVKQVGENQGIPTWDGIPTAYQVATAIRCGHAKSKQLRQIMIDDNVDLHAAMNIRNTRKENAYV